MKIYPSYRLRPVLAGESRVYDLLSITPDPAGFAAYSVNLPEHEYKRWAEADFVLVTEAGLTLLEVKGGTVSLAGREWQYQNARGNAITSTEGPAKQAISAAVALEKLLGIHLGRRIRCRWGVVFPLCRFKRDIPELPSSRLADQDVCAEPSALAEWLRAIPFDQHSASDFALTVEEIASIHDILVPEFTAAATLGLVLRSTEQQIVKLTAQQFAMLECLESNQRLMIAGGAGTGKTELAALCARADKAAGRKPAIVTSESRFSEAFAWRMREHGIPVVSDQLPDGTDTLVVDEGQDYANQPKLDRLFAQLPGGIGNGRWRWFMDPNLQFLGAPPDPACVATLTASSATVTLRRNVRSTREIVGTIRSILNADVGVSEIDGFGIKVGFHDVAGEDETAAAGRLILELLDDGILPREIAVLGAGDGEGPVCRGLLAKHPQVLRRCSQANPPYKSGYGSVAAIREFRGMEARVVVLVDLQLLCSASHPESQIYIGMSRASAALHLFAPPAVKSMLREMARENFMREDE